MLQAAVCDGGTLDALTLGQDRLGPSEVNVSRGKVVDAIAATKLRDAFLAAQPFQHDADLLFGGVVPAGLTPNVLQYLFCWCFIRP